MKIDVYSKSTMRSSTLISIFLSDAPFLLCSSGGHMLVPTPKNHKRCWWKLMCIANQQGGVQFWYPFLSLMPRSCCAGMVAICLCQPTKIKIFFISTMLMKINEYIKSTMRSSTLISIFHSDAPFLLCRGGGHMLDLTPKNHKRCWWKLMCIANQLCGVQRWYPFFSLMPRSCCAGVVAICWCRPPKITNDVDENWCV